MMQPPAAVPPHGDQLFGKEGSMAETVAAAPAAHRALTVRPPQWVVLGVLFGALSAVAIALYGPIGVSTTYPRVIGSIMRAITPGSAASNPYLEKIGGLVKPETMLVVGLLIGGFLSRVLWREKVPPLETVHPEEKTTGRRYLDAFLGGFLILFGARLAGGCTSGHIISGITQLALSGMLFAAGVFGAGIVTAKLLKGGH